MGCVYLASDTKLGRQVAVKFLPLTPAGDTDAHDRLEREARAVAALNHPAICAIYSIEEHANSPFLVLEYVPGKTFQELIEHPGEDWPPPVPVVAGYMLQAAEALQAAHLAGIIHRDIKSSNLMLTIGGRVKILDFGLARMTDGRMTLPEGGLVGTPAYVSPEQSCGEPVDGRSDLWSLGAVFFEILTGRLPFPADNMTVFMRALLAGEPESLRRFAPDVPDAVVGIVERLLRRDLERRYQSAQALAEDLRVYLSSVEAGIPTGAPVLRPDSAAKAAIDSLLGYTEPVYTDKRASGPAPVPPPSENDVRGQTERILRDPLFQRSERLSTFFRFIVEMALVGRGEEIKESVLGTEVFGRAPSYDPHEDPVVRVMAGRLRGKLAEYYQSTGQADLVAIALPPGEYVPQATWRSAVFWERTVTSKTLPSRAVGRAAELSDLRAAFATVAAGSGLAVMITGEAGVGKTTLAEEFLSHLPDTGIGAFVGVGQCSERLAETEAFVPILEILDNLLRREQSGDLARRMKSTAPDWYEQVAGETADDQSNQSRPTSPERMRRELISFFEELSRDRPVVLFLDDVQWADSSTCDLLTYVGARMNRTRLLLLMAYRPGTDFAIDRAPTKLKLDLERRGKCREIPVSFLTEEDVASYIAQQFPRNTFPESLPQIVYQRTEGNALFMTEMLRYLRHHRVLVEEAGIWSCTRPPSEIRQLIPVGISSMIRLKVQKAGEEDRMILLAGAVQGLQFDSAVVALVLSRDPADVEERLEALDAEHDFVRAVDEREFSDGTLSVRYRFIHLFYQHALYESLVPSRRAGLCLETARRLVGLTGAGAREIASDLAVLFEAGRDMANASEHFLHAARNAARVFAYAEAATLCERGLKALALLPESRERHSQELRFSLIHGLALMATCGYAAPEVEKTYTRSRELCRLVEEKRRLVPVLWGLHTCYANRCDLRSALDVAQEMVRTTEDSAGSIARVEALHALGTTLWFMGRLREGRETLERIFKGYSVNDHVLQKSIYVMDPCVTSLSLLARALAYSGFLNQALEKAEDSIKLAQRLGHPSSLTYAMFWRGYIRHTRGENAQCCDDLETAMTMSRKNNLPLFLEWARIVRGSALGRMGRSEEAIAEMRGSLERQSEMRSLLDRPYCLTLLAEALAARGARDEAQALCDEALEFTARTECRWYEPETHRIKGEVLMAAGDDSLQEAIASEFASALRLARRAGCRLLELSAAKSIFGLHLLQGDMNRARTLLRRVVMQFREGDESSVLRDARRLLEG